MKELKANLINSKPSIKPNEKNRKPHQISQSITDWKTGSPAIIQKKTLETAEKPGTIVQQGR